MEEIYTDLSLIKYIYKETGIAERFEIEYAIENDTRVGNVFQKFYRAYKLLPRVLFRPHKRVVEKIINFSNTYAA